MAGLCLLDENGAVAQRWELGNQPVAVGRGDTADLTIPDVTLSRRHFLIWREDEGYLIKDLNSQNGTWVDGQRAQKTKLRHNVCIVAGQTVFMFSEHHPATARAEIPTVLPAALAGRPAPALSRATASPGKTG